MLFFILLKGILPNHFSNLGGRGKNVRFYSKPKVFAVDPCSQLFLPDLPLVKHQLQQNISVLSHEQTLQYLLISCIFPEKKMYDVCLSVAFFWELC